jgi:membrane associated rhomboid family serine protease
MLNDRDYMRYQEAPFRQRPPRRMAMPSFLFLIIGLNVAMYFLAPGTSVLGDKLALVSLAVRDGQVYRLISSMFVHGNFWHLFFNMWGLYLFGSLLEKRIGSSRFVMLYFISGLLGGGFWLLANWNSPVGCIGASGALFGVIVGAAMFFPDIQIMLMFPPIPMKLRTFAIVYAAAEVFLEMSKIGEGYNIAHIVHLGGFVGGYLYLVMTARKEIAWDPFGLAFCRRGLYDVRGDNPGFTLHRPEVSQGELDRILDKISTKGVNALSEEEMETLRRAREEMRKGK